ncbi:MAG: MBL fold metallo-hydrolase [Oscillospiraceae bacterium]|nr:MBL fold metallo-hydrolase [Oscillospiraceae bacterium]MCL2227768.1 MBL fold metallo-hydrolase [Oscillospiraceae bacterium]
MLIKTLPVGMLGTNCYVVTDEKTLKCAIIDPGGDSNTILDYIESNKLVPEAILLTHGHFDHHMALEAVMDATGAPAYINKNDATDGGPSDQHKLDDGGKLQWYSEGNVIAIGGLEITVFETPGHSPGSVTLKCENALFTGDTLFRDSCGRTDLGGGSMEILLASLKRLSDLDGDYEIYPGHAESSTLSRERKFNYYVKHANGEE